MASISGRDKHKKQTELKISAKDAAKLPEKEKSPEQVKAELMAAHSEIDNLNLQLTNAFRSIDHLIKRVAELESSKVYKLRRFLSFYFKRLRNNVKKGDKKNIFSIFFNYVFKRGMRIVRVISAKILKHVSLLVEVKKVVIVEVFSEMLATTADYSQYLYRKLINKSKRKFILNEIKNFKEKPLISIVIPVYDPPIDFFTQALDSVINQLYPNWEICMADDRSTDEEVKEVLDDYASRYPNIKVVYREENGHIS